MNNLKKLPKLEKNAPEATKAQGKCPQDNSTAQIIKTASTRQNWKPALAMRIGCMKVFLVASAKPSCDYIVAARDRFGHGERSR